MITVKTYCLRSHVPASPPFGGRAKRIEKGPKIHRATLNRFALVHSVAPNKAFRKALFGVARVDATPGFVLGS